MDWQFVSGEVGGKDSRQCFDRWVYLRRRREPAAKHLWTEAENEAFKVAREKHGSDWKEIQREFFLELTVGQLVNKQGVVQKQERRASRRRGEDMVRELNTILEQRKE